MVGFYDLNDLCSTGETARQKAHRGIFPWSNVTIRRMWERGEFPRPVKLGVRRNAWRCDVVDRYAELLSHGVALAEAVVQAEAAVA